MHPALYCTNNIELTLLHSQYMYSVKKMKRKLNTKVMFKESGFVCVTTSTSSYVNVLHDQRMRKSVPVCCTNQILCYVAHMKLMQILFD